MLATLLPPSLLMLYDDNYGLSDNRLDNVLMYLCPCCLLVLCFSPFWVLLSLSLSLCPSINTVFGVFCLFFLVVVSFLGWCLLVACMGMPFSIVTLALFLIIILSYFPSGQDCINTGSITWVLFDILLSLVSYFLENFSSLSFAK